MADKRGLIDEDHARLSVRRQCELLGLARASLYYQATEETAVNLRLMRLLDEEYTRHPFYGSRRLTAWLNLQGEEANRKRVQRLMRLMGLEAIYPKPRLSVADPSHRVYPYLLRGVGIERVNQVWSADITYVPMPKGFMYLAATIDWYSRYVVSWRLSNTLDGLFCQEMLDEALGRGRPEIFNTDQGVQFTALAFTERLKQAGVLISMDGRGRCLDNVFVERLWRTVKYENIYLQGYATVAELERGLRSYLRFYNEERLHQSLDYQPPLLVYRGPGRCCPEDESGTHARDKNGFSRHGLRCPKGEKKEGPRPTSWKRGPQAPSAHRRPSYPSAGCVPAEPASVSLGGETIATTAGRDKANARAAGEGGKSVAKKWAFLV